MASCPGLDCCIWTTVEASVLLLQLGLEEASILALPPPYLVLSDGMKIWMLLKGIDY